MSTIKDSGLTKKKAYTVLKTLEDFDLLIKEPNVYIVLKFSTTWCGPCHRIMPNYIRLAESVTASMTDGKTDGNTDGKTASITASKTNHAIIKFASMDVDSALKDYDDFISMYDIDAFPTFMVFINGKHIKNSITNHLYELETFLKTL